MVLSFAFVADIVPFLADAKTVKRHEGKMEKTWLTHQNPIERFFYIQSFSRLSSSEKSLLSEQFLKGDWDVFGAWARLVIGGKIERPASISTEKTPHQRFWSDTFWNVSREQQNDFLSWLLSAQLANAGAKNFPGLGREWPVPSASSSRLLVQYLDGFNDPRRDLQGAFPDERLIDLLRNVSFDEALPILRKVVLAKRYFHLLRTDYSTSPDERDNSLRAALGVFIERAKSDRPAIKAELESLLKVSEQSEIVSLTIENVQNGEPRVAGATRSNIQVVEVELQKKPDVSKPQEKKPSLALASPESGGIASHLAKGIRARADWIKLSMEAIAGKSDAMREFDGFLMVPPQANWMRGTGERSIAILDEVQPNGSEVFGSSVGLDAFNRINGKLRFSANMDEESESHSMDRHVEYFVRGDGRIAMSVAFFEKTPKLRRSYHVVVIDQRSGEVLEIVKTNPDTGASVKAFGSGYLFENSTSVWFQGFDGSVKAERKKKKEEKFFITISGRAFQTADVSLEEISDTLTSDTRWTLSQDSKGHLEYPVEAITEIDGELYVANSSVLLKLSKQGEVLWANRLQAQKPGLAPIADKDTLWVVETFSVVSIDRKTGKVRKRISSQSEIEQWVPVGSDRIALLTKSGFFHFSKKEEVLSKFVWPKEFQFTPHMTSLSVMADGQGGVILKSYSDGHWLMRLK